MPTIGDETLSQRYDREVAVDERLMLQHYPELAAKCEKLEADCKALEADYLRIISAQDEKHRAQVAELRQQVASLRQHKTDYMEAAEQTRRALEAECARLAQPVVIDTCDCGHRFAKLEDHPRRDGKPRCPHCMAAGLVSARAERDALAETLRQIGDYAHDKSAGPAVPDALWTVRGMAYQAIGGEA